MSANLTTSSSGRSLSKMASAAPLRHSHASGHHATEDPESPVLRPERRNSDGDLKPIPLTSEHLRDDRRVLPKPPISTPESMSPSYSPIPSPVGSRAHSRHDRQSSRGSIDQKQDPVPVTRRKVKTQDFSAGWESVDPLFPANGRPDVRSVSKKNQAAPTANTMTNVPPKTSTEDKQAALPAAAASGSGSGHQQKDEHHIPEGMTPAKLLSDTKPKTAAATTAATDIAGKTAADMHHATQAAMAPVKASLEPVTTAAAAKANNASQTVQKVAADAGHAVQKAAEPVKEKLSPAATTTPKTAADSGHPVPKAAETKKDGSSSIPHTVPQAAADAGHAVQKAAEPVKDQLSSASHTVSKSAADAGHAIQKTAEPAKSKLTSALKNPGSGVESNQKGKTEAHHEQGHAAGPSSALTPPPKTAPAPESKSERKTSSIVANVAQHPATPTHASSDLKPSPSATPVQPTSRMHPPRGHERSKRSSSGSIEHVDDLVPVTRSKSPTPISQTSHNVKAEPVSTPKIMHESRPVRAPDTAARPSSPKLTPATSAAAITAALLGRAASPKLDTSTAPHAADVSNPAHPISPKPDSKIARAPSPSPARPVTSKVDTKATRSPSPSPTPHLGATDYASHRSTGQHAHFADSVEHTSSVAEQSNPHKTVEASAVRRSSNNAQEQGLGPKINKTFLIGAGRQPQKVSTHLLITKSPYFARLFARDPTADDLPYPDVDDFTFKIWQRWLNTGSLASLTGTGAEDFHALTHFLGAYCMAVRWEMEALQNQIMDLIRNYYAKLSLTSPPYRIEYIYSHTIASDLMRDFLISSAAWRAINEPPISDSMKALLAKGGDLANDFIEALIKHAQDPYLDVRKLDNCEYHVHTVTPPCNRSEHQQQYIAQFDGSADDFDRL